MPELPQPKARPHPKEMPHNDDFLRASMPGCLRALSFHQYAELHVTSNFTFLTGASHPDELVQQAAELGYHAIAITDRNSLAGIVRAHVAAKEIGIPLVVGCRLELLLPWQALTLEEEKRRREEEENSTSAYSVSSSPFPLFPSSLSLLVYPTNRAAYARLCRLLTLGKRRAPKGECHLTLHDVIEYNAGLLGVVIPPPVIDQDLIETLRHLKLHFDDDRLSLAMSCAFNGDDRMHLQQIATLGEHLKLPVVATNDVHYHVPQRKPLQDVLTCIRHGCTIEQAGYKLFPNAERYLKPPDVMAELFEEYPQAMARSVEIAARASAFSLDELRYQYPDEVVPPGMTPMEYLIERTWTGAAERYPQGTSDRVRNQIEHEFKLIQELDYAPYFLTVYDIVKEARSRQILCQGRGAAANSAVCYCLGVTSVDPDRIDVLFERFVSKERNEPPDIDVDFEHERREEIIQYIYQKYGRDRAGLTAEVITYRGRSAVRDVGKAMGLSLDCVDRMAKNIDWWSSDMSEARLRELGLNPHDRTIKQVLGLTSEILGFPRHLSQHVGGFVITRDLLCDLVPIENAAMEDRTVIEWDKDDIEAMGMLKIDVLGLGMLTCIAKGLAFVNGLEATKRSSDGATEGEIHSDEWRSLGSEIWHETRGASHDNSENISKLDCMAEVNDVSRIHLPSDAADAGERTVWPCRSDASSSGVSSIEHCIRTSPTNETGLPQASPNRPRITGGIINTTRTGESSSNGEMCRTANQPSPRSGSNTASVDSQSESEARIKRPERWSHGCGAFDPARNLVLASLYDPKQCLIQLSSLNPQAPSSLRPSVAPSLPLQLHTIPPEDPLVYDMICAADTVGVFQIESRAQMSMLPRLRPRCFYDLVIEVAIVRPGPIQGNMVHPYLRRRNGQEKITYPDARVEKVLKKTLGVPLFQEQAMSLAIVAAGFTPGEADQLRRAIAAWKTKGNHIEKFGERLMKGMIANGYDREFAERCFEQIKGFSGYGFPESHAASFALLVYVSAWLKCHYPQAFAAALLNSQPMGFYAPAQIVRDAKDHGVTVLPIDVNCSGWDCSLEMSDEATQRRSDEGKKMRHEVPRPPSSLRRSVAPSLFPCLRLGMRLIRGLSEVDAKAIAEAVQKNGPFDSIESLHRASGVRISVLRKLAAADAFNSMGLDRQSALWQVRALRDERLPIFEQRNETTDEHGWTRIEKEKNEMNKGSGENNKALRVEPCSSVVPLSVVPSLPPVSEFRKVAHDCAATGLSLRAHPMSFIRDRLAQERVTPNGELKDESRWPHGRNITVAGLVLVRQRPSTANGIIFMTLEDETGIANLILQPKVYQTYRKAARHGVVVQVKGRVERQGQVVHIVVRHLKEITLQHGESLAKSRDFH